MRVPESILREDHPSYGCNQAWFIFGVVNPNDGITRVLIVEAKNTWAVQTLECITNADNKVNKYCELMTVGRNCSSIGTRSNRAVEMSYVDFILDIVEPSRLTKDYYISTTFARSFTDEDRAYALAKEARMRHHVVLAEEETEVSELPQPSPQMPRTYVEQTPIVQTSTVRHKAVAALLDLGFKKQQVSKVMDEIIISRSVEDTVKSALQHLYAE
jgi:hypothetical protein